jgi:integrase
MTNPRADIKKRDPLTDEEIDWMLTEADKIEKEYFKLRAKAVVALAKVFGKRRSEIVSLEMEDLKIKNNLLSVTFKLRKKRKKGKFQYLKFLEKKIIEGEMTKEELDSKTQQEIEEEWKEWQLTNEGVRIKEPEATWYVEADSKFGSIIITYLIFMRTKVPNSKYLFPAGREIIDGTAKYIIDMNNHIGGRTLLNIVKSLNPKSWMHLFRELKGQEIVEQYGDTITAVYQVKKALNLEREDTAYRYVERYAIHKMKGN